MRKILFALLAVALLIVVGLVIYKGATLGRLEIWGIKQIIAENKQIDDVNAQLERLANEEFNSAKQKLDNSGEAMQATKKEYEEQAVLISNSKYYMQTEKYKIDFLWTRIGNYAKDHKVTPKMDVASGSTKGVYNLIITAVGKYPDVADFIYAIENDSRLGFKIEDFSMSQYTSEEASNLVQGKFTCKEIRIDIKSIDSESKSNSSEKTADSNSQSNANENNNTTNTTSTTNATSTTNTTNSNTTNQTNSNVVENQNNAETTKENQTENSSPNT